MVSLANKLCVVTGANTGIGRVIATELARADATVIMACRSRERAEAACAEVRRATGNEKVRFSPLDLTSLTSVRQFACDFGRQPLYLLVSNAGVMQGRHELTEDGFETTWQVNALGPVLLARLLLPNLRAAAAAAEGRPAAARLIYVGSMLDKKGDMSDLQTNEDTMHLRFASSPEKFSSFAAYGTSKLAGTLLHLEAARQEQRRQSGVCVNVVSPGIVATELNRNLLPWPLRPVANFLLRFVLKTPAQGAETALLLATSDEAKYTVTGTYFRDGEPLDRSDTIPVNDVAIREQLQETCDAMLG